MHHGALPGAAMDPATGLVEVDWLGTGFLLVARAALERIASSGAAQKIERADGALYLKPNEAEALAPYLYDFFPLGMRNGVYTAEDVAFCRNWRAIGGKVYADPSIVLRHVGSMAYEGDPMTMFAPVVPAAAA